MTLIKKVKDNSKIPRENLSDCPKIINSIANKTLEQLESLFVFPETLKESDDIMEKQRILYSTNEYYFTENIMGFIGYQEERLIIKSRFADGDNDYFLQYLLKKVLDIPNIVDLNFDVNQENQLFDMFLFIFPYYLKVALRKGLFKTYVVHKYNDQNVKGIIDISRHITLNTPFLGKIAYNQREYSYDNDVMELIRHTIEYIKSKTYGNKILANVTEEVKCIVEATPKYEYYDRQKIIIKNRQNPVRHAYYYEYRALQKLCILILQHQKHQLETGPTQIYGILFDGAWLWEEYINTLLKQNFYHPMNRIKKETQYLFTGNTGKIYPDFISKNTEKRIIADAKYKPITNIYGTDYLQLLAYMFRFDSRKGYYLYPEENENLIKTYCLNRGTSYEHNMEPRDIWVTKLGLKIPRNVTSYEEFVKQMEINEKEFQNNLKILLIIS